MHIHGSEVFNDQYEFLKDILHNGPSLGLHYSPEQEKGIVTIQSIFQNGGLTELGAIDMLRTLIIFNKPLGSSSDDVIGSTVSRFEQFNIINPNPEIPL